MRYFLDLFSPATYEAFMQSDKLVSGFRVRQRLAAERVQKGDRLICYMTKLSRWFGVLEVLEGPFEDDKPIFQSENDPFSIRMKVRPVVLLPKERAIPIHEDDVWPKLSMTREHNKNTATWTGKFRSSLIEIPQADGQFLEALIKNQETNGKTFPVDESEYLRFVGYTVAGNRGAISVTVPTEKSTSGSLEENEQVKNEESRESIRIQALIAGLGREMGFDLWVARADRALVKDVLKDQDLRFLDKLPLSYDGTTLNTIEQIDVLWLKGRSIVRAFEIEHTTSIYSGILRMADLLALQPNMNINLHIVAPTARREKVFSEIRRPVFALLDRGPMAKSCTYLSYESVKEIRALPHVGHMTDSVLDEYAEEAE